MFKKNIQKNTIQKIILTQCTHEDRVVKVKRINQGHSLGSKFGHKCEHRVVNSVEDLGSEASKKEITRRFDDKVIKEESTKFSESFLTGRVLALKYPSDMNPHEKINEMSTRSFNQINVTSCPSTFR